MPENNFEKQVQQKMEEFKLRPSDAVWPKVEERIREKKRRRFLLIILPVLAGLALVGYWSRPYWNWNKTSADKVAVTNTVKKINQDRASTVIQKNEQQQTDLIPLPALPTEKKPASVALKKNRETTFKNQNQAVPPKTEEYAKVHQPKEQNKLNQTVIEDNFKNEVVVIISRPEKDLPVAIDKKPNAAEEKIADPLAVKNNKSSEKIKPGLHFSTGLSGINSRVFPFISSMEKSADLLLAPSAIISAPGLSVQTVPTNSQPGLAFEIGVVMEKKLSSRSSISTGLRYNYFSDHIKVGNRRDSSFIVRNTFSGAQSVSSFYRGNALNNYINRYHFISLPVTWHLQINKGIKLPVTWDAGLIVSRLIQTNGLVYDSSYGGFYYHNSKMFNKTHFAVSTGFSLRVNSTGKMQWTIGPQLQVGLSNLRKSEFDRNRYILSGGIKINLLFTGK